MHVEDFTGRGASVGSLCEGFLAGAPVHAALLLGPAGVGKRTLAHTLAQSLFCTGPAPKPCGVCPGCKRYLACSHPDAYRIPEQKRTGVDEIRGLIAALQSAAYEGGWRTVVIEGAGAMTTQAQNSLLKTLEEPPPKTVFLLTAASAAQLLPTIRSRCRIVQVPPMSAAQVEAILLARGVCSGRAVQLAGLSQGSVGRALALDGDEAFWALREKLYRAMDATRGPGDVLATVGQLKDDRGEAWRIGDLLESALRDAMVASLQGGDTAEPGWPATLKEMNAHRLVWLLERLQAMRQMLERNVPWQAALERFLLEYTEDMG